MARRDDKQIIIIIILKIIISFAFCDGDSSWLPFSSYFFSSVFVFLTNSKLGFGCDFEVD